MCLLKRTPVIGFSPTRIQYDLILTICKDTTSRYSLRFQVDLTSVEMLFNRVQAHSAAAWYREVTRSLKVWMSKWQS